MTRRHPPKTTFLGRPRGRLAAACAPITALALLTLAPSAHAAGPTAERTSPPGKGAPAKPEKGEPAKAEKASPGAKPVDTFEDEVPASGGVKSGEPAKRTGSKTGPSVLFLPFAPIYRSVEQGKVQTANDLISKELDQKESFVVIRGGVAKNEVSQASADDAKKAIAEAEQAEAAREIEKAVRARRKAIEELEKVAAGADADTYVLAHHHLARALMWSGDDKGAEEVLDAAARMRPAFALEATQFSRLYRALFAKAAEKVMAEKPGDLLVKSVLPGASITLDGRPMEVAPVLLKRVVPGKHLVGAELAGVPRFAAVVEVKSGQKNELTVTFSNTLGGAAVGAVAEAVSENTIPKKAVDSAAQAGREAGAAFVVFGGLARGEDRFHVHPFVVNVAKGTVAPLGVVDFDLELLTAESDVLRIVENVAAQVASFSGTETAVPTIEKRIKPQATVNEVAAAPAIGGEDEGARGRRDQVVTPGAQKKRDVYKPLKGSKVTIKDEEEE